jgi:hypothetical protein
MVSFLEVYVYETCISRYSLLVIMCDRVHIWCNNHNSEEIICPMNTTIQGINNMIATQKVVKEWFRKNRE